MELYEQILCETIAREVLPSLQIDYVKLLEQKCYQAIVRIRKVVEDQTLEDSECFERVEEIVCALDDLGIGGGGGFYLVAESCRKHYILWIRLTLLGKSGTIN